MRRPRPTRSGGVPHWQAVRCWRTAKFFLLRTWKVKKHTGGRRFLLPSPSSVAWYQRCCVSKVSLSRECATVICFLYFGLNVARERLTHCRPQQRQQWSRGVHRRTDQQTPCSQAMCSLCGSIGSCSRERVSVAARAHQGGVRGIKAGDMAHSSIVLCRYVVRLQVQLQGKLADGLAFHYVVLPLLQSSQHEQPVRHKGLTAAPHAAYSMWAVCLMQVPEACPDTSPSLPMYIVKHITQLVLLGSRR